MEDQQIKWKIEAILFCADLPALGIHVDTSIDRH